MTALASDITRDLLILAKAYAKHEFRTLEALSGMACGKGGFFAGLERGGNCFTATAARVLTWFDQSWPRDLRWPDIIPRPSGDQGITRLLHADPELLAAIA